MLRTVMPQKIPPDADTPDGSRRRKTMDANLEQAFEEWKEANRALLHCQQESHFALVRLLDAICDRIEKLSESQ